MTRHEFQIALEEQHSNNQLVPRIKKELRSYGEDELIKHCNQYDIPPDFALDLLVQMVLYKRANAATLVGLLRHHYKDSQETLDMILTCAVANLVRYEPHTQLFIIKTTISDEVQAELDAFQFPLPMVVKPVSVVKNTDTGYFLSKGSILLKDSHHMEDVCLDHINRVNRIPLCINHDTATMIKNQWKGLDKQKSDETIEDFNKRVKAFKKYERVSMNVISFLVQERNEFWMTYKYDKRGRTYAQGYHINPQGNDWNKAVIEFADKELVV